jgi:hypothetical protein
VIREGKWWSSLVSKFKGRHPALKHGAYSATALLPGEDAAEFEKLHQALIAELAPSGALEDDMVATMARYLWRKQNLATFRIAEDARNRSSAITSEKLPSDHSFPLLDMFEDEIDPAQRRELIRAAADQARQELGEKYKLVEIGEMATVNRLMTDLEVEERLDAMIDRCLKRLLFLRGLKSLSQASSSPPQQRITGPKRAA